MEDRQVFESWKEIAEAIIPALEQFGKYEFNIPVDGIRSINTRQVRDRTGAVTESFRDSPLQIREAVSISGTHATQDLDKAI